MIQKQGYELIVSYCTQVLSWLRKSVILNKLKNIQCALLFSLESSGNIECRPEKKRSYVGLSFNLKSLARALFSWDCEEAILLLTVNLLVISLLRFPEMSWRFFLFFAVWINLTAKGLFTPSVNFRISVSISIHANVYTWNGSIFKVSLQVSLFLIITVTIYQIISECEIWRWVWTYLKRTFLFILFIVSWSHTLPKPWPSCWLL